MPRAAGLTLSTQLVVAAADVEAEGNADAGAGGEAPRRLRAVGVAAVILLQVPGRAAGCVPVPVGAAHGPPVLPRHTYLHGYFSGTKWCRCGACASQRWHGMPDTVTFTRPR